MLVSTRSTNILLVLVLAVGIAVVAMLATGARGGPLDPPAAPASTGIPINEAGSWSQALSGVGGCNSPRFACVLGGAGVLDRETGLVWQSVVSNAELSQANQELQCQLLADGNRSGWRLPSVTELRSVLYQPPTGIPPGMPVTGGTVARLYWTMTPYPGLPLHYSVDFNSQTVVGANADDPRGRWCVRGRDAQ